jgi:hypothetical protein
MILAPAELAHVFFNRPVRITYLISVPHEMNLHSAELVPVSDRWGAKVMPLFEICGLVSGAKCNM